MASVSLARHEDVDAIEAVCRRAFEQMNYGATRGYTYDSDHIKDTLHKGIDSNQHIVTKYVKYGEVRGVMAVGLSDFSFYSVGMKQAFEIVWHGDPQMGATCQLMVQMALLKDMLNRLESFDVNITTISLDSQYLELERLLSRFGFAEGTRMYVRRS